MDRFEPSPDLFVKVQRSIEEDLRHRARVRRVLFAVGVFIAVVVGYLVLAIEVVDGVWTMSFVALETLVTAVMVAIVIAMGPAIRRFGEPFGQDVFRTKGETGSRALRLLDVAYYLIFSAFILMTMRYEPASVWLPTLADWVKNELIRIGGLLLLMGGLHVVLLLALPVVGLVFAANERRARIATGARGSDPLLDKVEAVITIVSWAAAVLALLGPVLIVINVIIGLGVSG